MKRCGAYSGPYEDDWGFICTLPEGHDGEHFNATTGVHFRESWPFQGRPDWCSEEYYEQRVASGLWNSDDPGI